jgi:hypothetical protein
MGAMKNAVALPVAVQIRRDRWLEFMDAGNCVIPRRRLPFHTLMRIVPVAEFGRLTTF